MRRLLATAMLFFTALSGLESVAGMVRDELVHSENASTVAAHTTDTDDTGAPARADHDHDRQQHEHGSAGDHCAHVHGVAILTSTDFPQFHVGTVREHVESVSHIEFDTQTLTHPPRA